MSLETIVNQQVVAATLQINFEIEKTAWNILQSMGLPADYKNVELAKKRLLEESPLYIGEISLRGKLYQDMYDDHPGLAYFNIDIAKSIEVHKYCTLSEAKQIGFQLLIDARKEIEDEEIDDGLFIPSSIVLLDQFGNEVQEFCSRYLGDGQYIEGWLEEIPSEDECAEFEIKAKKYDSEGSEESRWDNFDSARNCHKKANILRRNIAIAKACSRIMK